jgi:MYXO-CTERM domain-containing protein
MKTLIMAAALMFASTLGLAQTADQGSSNNQGANAPATRTDDGNHSNWGWLGLLGLAGLGGLAGRNRRGDMYDRGDGRTADSRTASDIRRAA